MLTLGKQVLRHSSTAAEGTVTHLPLKVRVRLVSINDGIRQSEIVSARGSSRYPITIASTSASSRTQSASAPPSPARRVSKESNNHIIRASPMVGQSFRPQVPFWSTFPAVAPIRQTLRYALLNEELMASDVESGVDDEARDGRGESARSSEDADGDKKSQSDDDGTSNSDVGMLGGPAFRSRCAPATTTQGAAGGRAAGAARQVNKSKVAPEGREEHLGDESTIGKTHINDADESLPAGASASPVHDIANTFRSRASTAGLLISAQSPGALAFEMEGDSDGDERSSSDYRTKPESIARTYSRGDPSMLTHSPPGSPVANRCGSAISDQMDTFNASMGDFDNGIDRRDEELDVDDFLGGQPPASGAPYIDTEDYREPILRIDEEDQIIDQQEDDIDFDGHSGDADQRQQVEDLETYSDTRDGNLPSRPSSPIFTSDAVEAVESVSISSHSSTEQSPKEEIVDGDGLMRSTSPASCILDGSVTSDSSAQTVTTAHIGIQAGSDKVERGVQVDQPFVEITVERFSEAGRKRKLADLDEEDDDTAEQEAVQTGGTPISLPVEALSAPTPTKRRRVFRSVLSYAGTLAAGMGIGAGALLYALNLPDEMD